MQNCEGWVKWKSLRITARGIGAKNGLNYNLTNKAVVRFSQNENPRVYKGLRAFLTKKHLTKI